MAGGSDTRRNNSFSASASKGPLVSAKHVKVKSDNFLPTYFTRCHRIKALKSVVFWIVNVHNLLETDDHVFVALANGPFTSSSWIVAHNLVVDNIKPVIHVFRKAVGTMVKRDTAITLSKESSLSLTTCSFKTVDFHLSELETVSIFVVDWIDTIYHS